MGLMEKFADPELFEGLSFGDKMIGSTVTMLMGMGITFLVLLLLWGFVALMGRFMGHGAGETERPAASGAVANSSPSPASADSFDDETIAAVIAAAVAAYQGSGSSSNLVVRKITRLSSETSRWTNTARAECLESRKF